MSEKIKQLIEYLQMFVNDDRKEITKYGVEISQDSTKLLLNYIEQLQQENKELKEILENNSKINIADHKYASEIEDKYLIEHNILTEFEKWLEERIKSTKLSLIEIITFKRCLEELQELKEGKK